MFGVLALRLLVAEDDVDLAGLLRRGLGEEGYAVDVATDGETALWRALGVDYDLLLLDIALPGQSGLAILKRVRETGRRTPVLFLTARDAVEDRVAGLDSGADDYLVKPFEWAELSARVRALLRRGAAAVDGALLFGDLEVDPLRRSVRRNGREIEVTSMEFDLLHLLVRQPHRVFSRSEIIEHLYDDEWDHDSNVIDVFVARLRRKLNAASGGRLFETVRGVGYRLSAHEGT